LRGWKIAGKGWEGLEREGEGREAEDSEDKLLGRRPLR
jgi:hypothetical protein